MSGAEDRPPRTPAPPVAPSGTPAPPVVSPPGLQIPSGAYPGAAPPIQPRTPAAAMRIPTGMHTAVGGGDATGSGNRPVVGGRAAASTGMQAAVGGPPARRAPGVTGASPAVGGAGGAAPARGSARAGTHFLAQHGLATDDPMEVAQRCAELLGACVTQTRLYGPHHPEASRLTEVLLATLRLAFAQLGPLEWTLRADGFYLGDQQLTVEKEERPGLAHALHMEGLASLRFEPGIGLDEVVRLLLALRVNLSLPAFEEETLESILFQQEFQHIGFDAVSDLMQAEALSGRQEDLETDELLDRLMNLPADRNPDLASLLGDRDLGTGQRLDREGLAADDGADWDNYLSQTEREDLAALLPERELLDSEREGDPVVRLAGLLLRATVARDPGVGAQECLDMAARACQQLYALGDPTCLLRFFEEGQALVRSLDGRDPAVATAVRGFLRTSFSPLRVARMMRGLSLDDPRNLYTLQRFITHLSPDVLVVFIEGFTGEDAPAHAQDVITLVWDLCGSRLTALLEDPQTQPGAIVTVLTAAQRTGIQLSSVLRSRLLRHRASLVKSAIVPFFRQDLPPEDVSEMLLLVSDRVPGVRKAAIDMLARHRPPRAWSHLAAQLRAPTFADLAPAVKTDLCIAAARVGGPSSLELLEELLDTRFGFRVDPRDVATVEAAARGLAALRTPNAMSLLERGAAGWSGPRRTACQNALQEGRPHG